MKKQEETKELQVMKEQIAELNDSIEQLRRMVRYSDNKPTFHLMQIYSGSRIKYVLYLYIDKEEYEIDLNGLPPNLTDSDCTLEVNNGIACLTIESIGKVLLVNYENHQYVKIESETKSVHKSAEEQLKEYEEKKDIFSSLQMMEEVFFFQQDKLDAMFVGEKMKVSPFDLIASIRKEYARMLCDMEKRMDGIIPTNKE